MPVISAVTQRVALRPSSSFPLAAFAEALSEIIAKRKRQANFQLILITHDEHFVDLLGRRELVDCYYRVRKNANQYSTIDQIPINE